MKLTKNERQILQLWQAFRANPDSVHAASILKMIVSIDRKGR